jgi:acyl carrier protein
VLAGIWAELLRVRQVGVDDNYFALGGHSLLATQLMSRVREAFGVEVALRRLFEEPTVAGLTAHVEGLLKSEGGASAPPLVRASREGRLPVSFAQQRLWFIDQLEPGNPFYNIPVAVRLSGVLDVGALERTLSEIIRRHEALRTHFAEADGEPVQVISPAEPLPLPLTDLSHLDEGEREAEARRLTAEAARTPFALNTPPLIKGWLLRLSTDEHVALLTMHHVVSDGWSTGVLIKEVAALYQAFSQGQPSPLAELEIQYADYAVWQRGWLRGEALEEQVAYWRKQLGGTLPVLELPMGRPRPAIVSHRGRTLSFILPREAADRLRELSRREGVTLFMTLLAAFKALLHRYTGQDDVVVGTPIAGRNRRETEGLIGFFVNTLALRTDLSGDPSVRDLLRRVREVTLSAYAHQDVPFEKLVEELRPKRSFGQTPLFQVMFELQNVRAEGLELTGLELRSVGAEGTTAKFDLRVTAVEGAGGELRVGWNYREELYEAAAVGRMAGYFGRVLEGFAGEPERRVSELVKASAAGSSSGGAGGRRSPEVAAPAGLLKSRSRPTPGVRRSFTKTTG